MKILKWLLIVVVILVVGVLVARNMIIKHAVRTAIRNATGFDLEMGRVHAGLFSPVFEVTDTKLINPEDFPERTAMVIETLRVVYDLPTVFTRNIHLKEITIDIPRATLLIREDGKTNLERLGQFVPNDEPTDSAPTEGVPQEKGEPEDGRRLRVDELTLRLGTLEIHQYEEGQSEPSSDSFDLNFDRTAYDVDSFDVVNGMITAAVIEGMGTYAIRGLSKALKANNVDVDQISQKLEDTVKDVGKSLKGLFGGSGEE